MPTEFNVLRNVRSQVAQALDQREKLLVSSASLAAQVAAFEQQAAEAAAVGNQRAAAAARARADAAQKKRESAAEKVVGIDQRVDEQLGRLVDLIDPCDAEADVPLALFPVRLETRYTDDGASVRIRIFPDDIHVDQLDRGLTGDEQAAARDYWGTIWSTDDTEVNATAFRELSARVHASRAAWVADAMTPTNVADAGPDTAPAFPDVNARARRPAVARLLPDRFAAVALQDGVRSTATGAVIAPELGVGLLSDDGTALIEGLDGLKVSAGTEWLYDYDIAVQKGMGITLPLAKPGAPVDQLFVFGVRSSLDAARGQVALEDLLRGHRYARGLAVVPQGTPTNNTESDRAAWQGKASTQSIGRVPAAPPAAGTNAAVIAQAFGIDPLVLANIDHANEREQPEAHGMNVALWWPSWGTMLDSVTTGVSGARLSDATREGVRSFFNESVRGRGPVPALRVGNQPYGILPVGSTDTLWRAHRLDALEGTLLDFLRRVRKAWRVSLSNVPRVDDAGAKIDDTMLEILGTNPVAQALRVRSVLPSDFPAIVSDATGAPQDLQELERIIGQLVLSEVIANLSFAHPAGSLAKDSRPLPLPLVHATDPAFIDALISGGRRAGAASVLQVLLELAWSASDTALTQASPPALVPSLAQSASVLPAALRDTVVSLADRADAVPAATWHATANLVAAQVGEAGATVLAQHAPIPALRTSLGELAIGTSSSAALNELAPLALGAWLRAQARHAELRDALLTLRDIGSDTAALDARRILVAETLDLASHRLDAWITGIVERRRALLRTQQPTGVMIGAYGYVEKLARGGGASRDGGYIHAPSLAQAATAGMLRNAYLTHNADAGGTGAFAVDLSSTRVRVALDLLEGLRQGQTLSALLGYRIERSLHERRLDRLALSLRALAPLIDGQLTARADVVPPEATEAVAASNVVDGLRLIALFKSSPATVLAALDSAPLNNPFIAPGDWPKLTGAEQSAVAAAIASADDARDAYADLVLAEGVHQLVQGNTGRAVAALDAGGSGESPLIEPTVVQTPTQGIPLTHRLMVIADGDGVEWNTARPRAKAEPRLERWAAGRLGASTDVVVHVAADGARTMLDSAGFCALDLVFESASRVRCEQAIRANIPGIPTDEPFVRERDPAWPASLRTVFEIVELAASLRELVVRARIANPSDFARASDAPGRTVSDAELAIVRARAMDARDGLAAAAAALAAALIANPNDDAALSTALEGVAGFGVATPRAAGELTTTATLLLAESQRRLEVADTALANTFDARAAGIIGQAIFGDGFWMIPAMTAAPTTDLFRRALDAGAVDATGSAIRRFVRDVASVRDPVARCAETLLLGDALGRRAQMLVAQLAAPGTPGTNRWIGGALDPSEPTPDAPVTALLFEAPPGYDGTSDDAVLVIDQWVDVVAQRARRGEGVETVIDERLVSGLAVNAPAASARAPQAILLAVSPDGNRWTTDSVLETLIDTIELAKLRAVTLERTTGAARVLPALYEQSWSLQGEPALDLRFVKQNAVVSATLQYVKESQP
ncbi:MAG: hypothetical protein ABJE47_05805 [bacterium]